jgi:competence protein ComFC
MIDKLTEIFNKILDFLLPRSEKVGRLERLDLAELFRLAKPAEKIPLPDCFAVFNYRDPLIRQAIWQLKYHGNQKISDLLGQALASEIEGRLENLALFENFREPVILPIPLSKERRKIRGFNQCVLLLNSFRRHGSPLADLIEENILTKTREILSQVKTQSREERLKNLKNCFTVANPAKIIKRNVILVDDVITTGATVDEARRTLLAAGAKRVIAFSVGH